MQKLTALFLCGLCFAVFFNGCKSSDNDSAPAAKVLEQYLAASANGDIDTMLKLTSARFRREFTAENPVNDPYFIIAKELLQHAQYEILTLELTDKTHAQATVITRRPDLKLVMAQAFGENRIDPGNANEVRQILLPAVINVLQTGNTPVIEESMAINLVKESDGWKINERL